MQDLLLNQPQFKSRLSPIIFGSLSSIFLFLVRYKIRRMAEIQLGALKESGQIQRILSNQIMIPIKTWKIYNAINLVQQRTA